VQGLGKIPISLEALAADSIALSAHKLHGPKGVGAVVVRRGVQLGPLWGGGKHERGVRPGTENAPGIVGFGLAVELATAALGEGGTADMAALRDQLVREICQAVPGARASCPGALVAPHIASIVVPHVRAEVLVHALETRGVYASAGAACASRDRAPSAVGRALGLADDDGLLRLSLARTTTLEDIAACVAALPAAVAEARLP
jgi:cysteine desulfurase